MGQPFKGSYFYVKHGILLATFLLFYEKFLKNKSQPFVRRISTDYSSEEVKPRNFIMNTLSSEKEEQNR